MTTKFSVDYTELGAKFTKKAYRLSEVKDQLEVIAWDLVRFVDPDKSADLWQVQSADDGDYIVALYEPDTQEKTADWQVSLSKIGADLQVSYKGDPIVRLAASKLGIAKNELHQVPRYLPAKLASNPRLVKALLNELPESAKNAVYAKYPELT